MTVGLDIRAEVSAITAALAARRDPAYEAGMRRTVPSQQAAHATRVADIRSVAAAWRRAHKGLPAGELIEICDALWATRWREERIAAVDLLRHSRDAHTAVGWRRIERWSEDIDNWEHVDHLADVTGGLLAANQASLEDVRGLEGSANPWQRRLALVTLIVAARRDEAWRGEMNAMTERLKRDAHALVRKAVVWARATERKLEARRG